MSLRVERHGSGPSGMVALPEFQLPECGPKPPALMKLQIFCEITLVLFQEGALQREWSLGSLSGSGPRDRNVLSDG
jgi:hypothetical protein